MLNAYTMNQNQEEREGKWIPSRPLPGPFVSRLRDAWKVLWGRAEAVTWSRKTS